MVTILVGDFHASAPKKMADGSWAFEYIDQEHATRYVFPMSEDAAKKYRTLIMDTLGPDLIITDRMPGHESDGPPAA